MFSVLRRFTSFFTVGVLTLSILGASQLSIATANAQGTTGGTGSTPSTGTTVDPSAAGAGTTNSGNTAGQTATAPTVTPNTGACGDGFISYICSAFAFILSLIADFIGRAILIVVSVLMVFAQYNGFSDAMPVQQGWIVVRDTTNMFFIIVLLISAFATVVGYPKEFHYSAILPKLLLQAVLINFSKTLIQLLIDFSQVIMLTFVNAFAQAAAGNFVYALGLDKMMQIGNSGDLGGVANIILAYMLAIFFMSIALGVTIILLVYLVYRIVMLWVSLIVAPIAFFVTALPSKLAKFFGKIGEKYWGDLTSYLTGGPTMAFFLWLTLAVTQRSVDTANQQGTLASALGLNTSSLDGVTGSVFGFMTSIADSQHVASFVVGIALMIAALDAAVAAAAAVGAGAIAGLVKSKALDWGKTAAKAPFMAAGAVTAGAARAGWNAVDSRKDYTRKMSLTAARGLKFARPFVSQERYEKMQGVVTKGANFRRKQADEIAKKDKAFKSELSSKAKSLEEREQLLSIAQGSAAGTRGVLGRVIDSGIAGYGGIGESMGTKASKDYFAEQFGDPKLIEEKFKRDRDNHYDELYKKAIGRGLTEKEAASAAKEGSRALVRDQLNKSQARLLGERYTRAKSSGNKDEQKKIEELFKLNPHLAPADVMEKTKDDKEISLQSKFVGETVDDPDKLKELGVESASQGILLTELMLKNGWDEKDGKLVEVDKDAWDRKKREIQGTNATLHKFMQAHERFARLSEDKSVSEFRQIKHVQNSTDKVIRAYGLENNPEAHPEMIAGVRVNNSKQEEALTGLRELVKAGTKDDATTSKLMASAIQNGSSLSEALFAAGKDPVASMEVLSSSYIAPNTQNAANELASNESRANEAIEKAIASRKKQYDKDLEKAITSLDGVALDAEEARLKADLDKDVGELKKKISETASVRRNEAITQAQNVIKVVAEVATSKRDQSESMLAEFLQKGGVQLLQNIRSYDKDTKLNLLAITEQMKTLADDIKRVDESKRSDQQRAIIEGYEEAIRALDRKDGLQNELKKNLTSYK